MPFSVRLAEPMLPTRPCCFCLSFQDDSVFADFDIDDDNRVFLLRISFDGYGCCRLEKDVRKMSLDDSRILCGSIVSADLSGDTLQQILGRYFEQNTDVIWRDALQAHALLNY